MEQEAFGTRFEPPGVSEQRIEDRLLYRVNWLVNTQKLIFQGQVMENQRDLRSYGIQDQDFVVCLMPSSTVVLTGADLDRRLESDV